MAVQSNNSEVEVSGGVTLYTGIAPVKVIAVNPTLDELKDLGINAKTDPNYSVSINNEEYNKITFWLECANPNFKVKFEILMQANHRESKTGKFMWINNVGQTTWSEDVPAYDWWKNADKTRKAFVGEDTLIDFTKAWANVANGGEVSFDTIDAIAKGDVKEIKQLVAALKDNSLRVLIGVKDEKYQQVYGKHFGRIKPMRDADFVKALNGDYGNFNAEYNKDLKLQVYAPSLLVADEDADTSAAMASSDDGDLWEN
jgi:hypothetical protein